MRGSVPTPQDFQDRRVTQTNMAEVIRQSYYDFQLYPTAGTVALSFFQSPIGQGLTTAVGAAAGQAKSIADTNMVLGGQLPSGVAAMFESIEVAVYPGSVATANTYTLAALGFFAAAAALTVLHVANDVNILLQSGVLKLQILQKDYLVETPLHRFPPKTYLQPEGAIASNSATTSEVGFVATRAVGRPYYLEPEISVQSAVNFGVRLEWPGAVATPSGFNARVGVILDGYVWRSAQ